MSQSETCTTVWDWLAVLRLEQYSETFQRAGLATLQQCRSLTPDQLERMGITLPGHRRRILASLNKTHGNTDTQSDTHSHFVPSERDQRSVETGHAKALYRDRPVPIPLEERPALKERQKLDGASSTPIPREREKPVPRERVSRVKEESGEGGENKPIPGQRQTAAIGGKEEERDGGIDGERERPVPKERTKFRTSAPVDNPPAPLVSPSLDTSLPPVPPRSTPNCPPQRFTSPLSPSPPPRIPASPPKLDRHAVKAPKCAEQNSRPQTLAIQPHAQYLGSEGRRRRASPSSPVASPIDDRDAPPLPPKAGAITKGPPPIPQRFPAQSPKTQSPSSTKTDEMQKEQTPLVPPRIKTPQTLENAQQSTQPEIHLVLPSKTVPQPPRETRLDSLDDDSDDYESPDLFYPSVHRTSTSDRDMSLQVPRQPKGRYSSLCSDDELLDDDEPTEWPDVNLGNLQGSVYLPKDGRLSSVAKEDSSHLAAVIKMGWLDKNPPQGALYYQRRWVKLDVDYLRYFDNEKEVYSKGIISTAFMTNVSSVGELKFEVVTNNRTFIFRAESEAERNEWVTVLQDCTRGRRPRSTISPSSPLTPDFQGYLELRGLRSKLYTVVASDKVYLYKNIEDYRIGVGITSIEMNVGNVKETDRRTFDLTTPYRIFSFIAESEQLREQWVDAMRDAIGEHRGLGPSISKVRSLKMDRKVWTEQLIQVFLLLGNERANTFWAANVPPSEALTPSSCSDERRRFITNKYRQGKYRKYHPLYGNQKELNNGFIPASAEPLLRLGFDRIGRLKCKDGLNLQTSKVGWFALVGSTLHVYFAESQGEEIHLRKLNELSIQQENEVLVLVERGRTLYIEGERKLDFAGWCTAIQAAAKSGGDTLSQQQLTETDIPVIVHSCISYITQCGENPAEIQTDSDTNSFKESQRSLCRTLCQHTQARTYTFMACSLSLSHIYACIYITGGYKHIYQLCERFRCDARSLCLRDGEHQVDDVSNTLKRFFRELEEGLFTSEDASAWLSTAAIQDESMKISQYQMLLNRLPHVNKATLQALINHLYCVQRFSNLNQMNLHNLAIVFGPTLFQTDGKDYTAGRTIEDLIQHYTLIFEVTEQQLKKQLDEIKVIIELRNKLNKVDKFPSTEPGGHFICTVYVEEKKEVVEQSVQGCTGGKTLAHWLDQYAATLLSFAKERRTLLFFPQIPGSMTAAELTCEILDRRNMPVKDKEYWSCWEVSDKEEMERPLHYQERVLPILHSFGTDSRLLIKKHIAMDNMIVYLAGKVDASKHGMMKFREERSILGLGLSSGSFHDRYFILNSSSLRMYKDVRSNRPEREWPVKNLKVYLGMKKKLRPPTCWGLTVVYESKKQEKPERQQWYLCCDTQTEMREWYATFLSIQYDGNVWPQNGLQQTRVSRVMPDTRHGNVSLIPLRGSENEMRNSVAAFSQDPLAKGLSAATRNNSLYTLGAMGLNVHSLMMQLSPPHASLQTAAAHKHSTQCLAITRFQVSPICPSPLFHNPLCCLSFSSLEMFDSGRCKKVVFSDSFCNIAQRIVWILSQFKTALISKAGVIGDSDLISIRSLFHGDQDED
ncbi:Arf-GAP with [Collichthys lucidus]|uniref:Arf-GAP with n=2 Tax=Sciaenidae TaxID=30870 RepID=A0A4U5V0H0_COLLU|nr:Arf-GAP with [Collichthys lucidus]